MAEVQLRRRPRQLSQIVLTGNVKALEPTKAETDALLDTFGLNCCSNLRSEQVHNVVMYLE